MVTVGDVLGFQSAVDSAEVLECSSCHETIASAVEVVQLAVATKLAGCQPDLAGDKGVGGFKWSLWGLYLVSSQLSTQQRSWNALVAMKNNLGSADASQLATATKLAVCQPDLAGDKGVGGFKWSLWGLYLVSSQLSTQQRCWNALVAMKNNLGSADASQLAAATKLAGCQPDLAGDKGVGGFKWSLWGLYLVSSQLSTQQRSWNALVAMKNNLGSADASQLATATKLAVCQPDMAGNKGVGGFKWSLWGLYLDSD